MGFGKKNQSAGYYDDADNYEAPDAFNEDYDTEMDDQPYQYHPGGSGSGGLVIVFVAVFLAVALFATAIGVTLIVFLPNRWECKKVIKDFEYACNKMDFYAVADCVDSRFLDASDDNSLFEIIFGKVLGKAVDWLGSFLGGGNGQSWLKIEPLSYGLPRRYRVVECRVRAGLVTTEIDVTIIKKHGKVYIYALETAD